MQTVSISDLSLIATLLYFDISVEEVSNTNPKRVEFYFKNDTPTKEVVASYYRGETSVEPKKYFSCLKDAKNRIYSGL